MATGIPVQVGELVDAVAINEWARGHWRKSTSKTVNTSTAATDLLNGEITIEAGAMSTNRVLRLSAWGDFKQNAAAQKDVPIFQLFLDGTKLIGTDNLGADVAQQLNQRFGWRIVCEIQNLGATNVQQAYLFGELGCLGFYATGITNAFGTGNGIVAYHDPGSAGAAALVTYAGGAQSTTHFTGVDTTGTCALELKVTNAFSNANYETKLLGALAEII